MEEHVQLKKARGGVLEALTKPNCASGRGDTSRF
jgi:hypothetical protein